MRLPYGKRTGVEAVDRLTIVAHDRFQEIVDFARSKDSPLRRELPVRFAPVAPIRSEPVEPVLAARIVTPNAPEPEQHAERVTLDVIREFEYLRNSETLSEPEIQERIVERVTRILAVTPVQPQLPGIAPATVLNKVELASIVAKATTRFQDLTIDIPRITVTPVDNQSGYRDFQLDLNSVTYQPSSDAI